MEYWFYIDFPLEADKNADGTAASLSDKQYYAIQV